MKKKLVIITAVLFIGLAILVARPCGFGRLMMINSWSGHVNVTVWEDGYENPVWQGTIQFGYPVKARVDIGGETSYRIRAENTETGEVQEDVFGYDTVPSGSINMFLIDHDDIHYHSWLIKPAWLNLTTILSDELSCTERYLLR